MLDDFFRFKIYYFNKKIIYLYFQRFPLHSEQYYKDSSECLDRV